MALCSKNVGGNKSHELLKSELPYTIMTTSKSGHQRHQIHKNRCKHTCQWFLHSTFFTYGKKLYCKKMLQIIHLLMLHSLCNSPRYQTQTCLKESHSLLKLYHTKSFKVCCGLQRGKSDLQKLWNQLYIHKTTSINEVDMHYPTARMHFISHDYSLRV
jgi:hypothetical protein